MEFVSAWFIAGIILAAFSASLFTKARIEEQYGRYMLVSTEWLFTPSANGTALLTIFAAGAGLVTFGWWYPLLLAAVGLAVAIPGGEIYRSGIEFLYTPGRLGERLRHWAGWDDRQVLRHVQHLLKRIRSKSSRSAEIEDGAQKQAREAIVGKAKILVDDRVPQLLSMRRLLREGITDVRRSLPAAEARKALPGISEFDILASRDTRLTLEVTEETEVRLNALEQRYSHVEDYLQACMILLVNLNARWYLLITSENPEELSAFIEELDALIDKEGKLLEQTERQVPTLVQS